MRILGIAIVALALGLHSSCVKQTTVTRHVLDQWISVNPAELGPHRPTKVRTAAFMPFQNTAQMAMQSVFVDIAFANELIASGMADFQRRTGIATLDPTETQAMLSDQNLTGEYAQVLRDYLISGLIDVKVIRRIATALRADVIVQGLLVGYSIEPVQYRFHNLQDSGNPKNDYLTRATTRWFVFNAASGRIEWNFITEVTQDYQVHISVEHDKTLAHIGLGITAAMAIAGAGVMFGGLDSDSPLTMIGVGAGLMLPVCFSPIGYGVGSYSQRVIPPQKSLLTMKEALQQMIVNGLRRVSQQFNPVDY